MNSYTAPRYRVETNRHRLVGTFKHFEDALECMKKGRGRLIYRHNRPHGMTEGNYSLLKQGA
jgi:hypothetical protein